MLVLVADLQRQQSSGASDDELMAIICAFEGDFNRMEDTYAKRINLNWEFKYIPIYECLIKLEIAYLDRVRM